MTATNALCREIDKLISSYLQSLVDAHEELFNIELRYDEIIDEAVSIKDRVIDMLQTPTAERDSAWVTSKESLEAQMHSLNEEISRLASREGTLYMKIGAYNRLIEVMNEKKAELGC